MEAHPYSMMASSGTKNTARGHDGLGDLTMIKQTKQTTLLNSRIECNLLMCTPIFCTEDEEAAQRLSEKK
jgi:hypothetical protein